MAIDKYIQYRKDNRVNRSREKAGYRGRKEGSEVSQSKLLNIKVSYYTV